MKKLFFTMLAFTASVTLFAQVDSTGYASDSAATQVDSATTAPIDSTHSTVPSDTTASGSSSSDTSASGISDDDLRKYAVVMDSLDGMKQALITEIAAKIKASNITIARYNEVYKASEDDAKLAEIKATPEEIKLVSEIASLKTQGGKKISQDLDAFVTETLGKDKYTKIKAGLTEDDELKSRYDVIFAEVQGDDSASAKTSN